MTNAIIIDDEDRGREFLHKLLLEYCSAVNVVAKADSIDAGIEAIQQYKPDLVFLDIMMPGGTGFDILEHVAPIDFDIIFTTAHDKFAIRAIRFSALDYLLKPIDVEELQRAVERVNNKNEAGTEANKKNVQVFLDNVRGVNPFKQIVLPTMEGLIFVRVEEIIRCQGEGSYSRIFLQAQDSVLVSRNLKEIEGLLADSGFFRVHKSHLINLNHIRRYIKGSGGFAVMSDGAEVEIAKRKKDEFIEKLH
ncbi:MAG: LytR/AlgR family response regulator transcription factor [Salibacteraceae bacterium]|mgnify:CR=1 FL=1